jgi:hypothetical protein
MPTLIVLQLENSLAIPIPDGYSWTLASRLGDMLFHAEAMFGSRDKSHTVLGVEFVKGDIPRIWYPKNCGNVVVQLTEHAMTDNNRACYQLAHEVIHLLAPTGRAVANVFEEGLATWFASWYMATQMGQPMWKPNIPSYQAAMEAVRGLLETSPDAVKKLRATQPAISLLQPDDLRSAFTSLNQDDAERLCGKFSR